MKIKLLAVLFPVMALSLTSCGQVKKYEEHINDYIFNMDYSDGFNILQLTDIHWNYNTSTKSSKVYLDKVFEETYKHAGRIDLVEVTGDLFMLFNSYHVDQFIKYFTEKSEQYNFKYAVIWGNHDHHGLVNPNELAHRFSKAKNCLHYDPNDNLYGRSNFAINLNKDGIAQWQIANLDSGASFSETAVSPFRDYDYIRPEQTKWWTLVHDQGAGVDVPAIAYYHIPQDENGRAYKEIHDEGKIYKNQFFKLEEFADNGNEKYASDFIDVAKDHNLQAAFMGHAHNIDWTVDYMDVTIGLGVKTGTELYYAHIDANSTDKAIQEGLASCEIKESFDLIGASLVTLTDNTGNFELEHLYLNERANGDFIRWVRY